MAVDRSESVRRYLAGPQVPATPRDAATVLILRDAPDGIEVFMMRRQRSMAFGPGMYVYPGGSVELSDHVDASRWAGPSPAAWAEWLDADAALAESLVCATIREAFEESGVLFAGVDTTSTVQTTDSAWEDDRVSLLGGAASLDSILSARGLVARTDLLRPFGRWITPIYAPKRFDTRFFLAALPAGAQCRDFGEESDIVAWVRPERALKEYHSGDFPIMMATADMLRHIASFESVERALAAPPRSSVPHMVRAIPAGDDFTFVVDGPGESVDVTQFLVGTRLG